MRLEGQVVSRRAFSRGITPTASRLNSPCAKTPRFHTLVDLLLYGAQENNLAVADITDCNRMQETLRERAIQDSLTGLFNWHAISTKP